VFYFTCNHRQRLHVKQNTEIISKLFQNNFISHVTKALHKRIRKRIFSKFVALFGLYEFS